MVHVPHLPAKYQFFHHAYFNVHREGDKVVVTRGDLEPVLITTFTYGTQRTELQQAAQWKIEAKDPLIIDDENIQLIDDDDC